MGYSTSGGPDGLGVFNNTPATTSDFNQVIAVIAMMGNTQKGVAADRDAISGDQLYPGLLFTYTDRALVQFYDGSGWVTLWKGATAVGSSVTPVAGSGFTLSNNALFTRNGFLLGTIDWAKTSGTLGHADVICTLPVGARPSSESSVITSGSPSPSYIFPLGVSTTGAVSALLPVSGRTGGTLRFNIPIPY